MMRYDISFVGAMLIILSLAGCYKTPDSSMPSSPPASSNQPPLEVIVDPNLPNLAAPSEAGTVLQQPEEFSGQESGVTDLQNSAQLTPEDLNRFEIK